MSLADDNGSVDTALEYYFECLDRGDVVDEASLLSKFPQHEAELRRFFADQRLLNAKVQRLRSNGAASHCLKVRCPNCHQPTEVAVDSTLTDLECPSCASRFNLIGPSTATNGSPPLLTMGRFHLLERLGMGAYGSVWKARDDSLDRIVAIKIPRQGGMTSEEQEKFFREARAVAQLRHPNIVSVHEVGRDGDSVYIVSDFVRGVTLGDWLEGHPLAARDAAELCVTIANALHHAHEQGVVHRDLKPANIIMDADGQPHLMDFGLARRDVGEVTVTMDGQVLGTPAYMSPEQAEGKAHAADRRSDVYSLGVLLFQLLTGELPFRGNARMLIHQVIHDEPPSPRKLNANIRRDLETIVGKAMEKRAGDRYASAGELGDDLRRYLAGKPIKARPATYADKFVKWSRRHRTIVGVVGVAAVVLTAVLAASFVLINKEKVAALTALEDTSELLYTADMNAAYDAWDQGWSDEAQTILARQVPKGARPDQRGLEWFLLDRLTRPPVPTVLAGHEGSVNELAVFPDRRRLASVGEDGTLRIWDLSSKTAETIPLGKEPLYSVAVSPDGRYVAAGSSTIYLCDLHERSTPRQIFRGEHNFESVAFSADGKRLAAGQRYDNVCLLSLDGEVIQRVPCASRVETLEFVPGQPQLLVPNRIIEGSRQDGSAQLWREDLSAVERELKAPRFSGITFARPSPCGEFIAATEQISSRTYVFHRASGRVVLQTRRGRDRPTALAYSPDGGTIGVAHLNGVVEFFNVGLTGEGELVTTGRRWAIDAQHGDIFDIKFIEAEIVATCGADGLVKVWDLSQTITRPIQRGEGLYHVELSPDGELLACGSHNNFRLIDQRGENVHRHSASVGHVAWSPSGKRVAVCRENDQVVDILDRRGELVFALAHDEVPVAAAYSPDERMLAIIGQKYLLVCRADDGREIHRHALGGEGASAVAFSPDGRHLAYGGRFGAIVLADGTGKRVQRELPCNSDISTLAFSQDGSLLASGHADSVIRVWSVNNGTLRTELSKHERAIESLAFSPDGRTLLSSAYDGMISVWSVVQNRDYGAAHRAIPQEELSEAGESRSDLSLSADGRWLAITYRDRLRGRTVELWDLQSPADAAF